MHVPSLRHSRRGLPRQTPKGTPHVVELNTTTPSSPSPSPTITAPTSPSCTTSTGGGILLFVAGLGFWSIVDQQGIQRQRIRQDEVADIVSPNGKCVQGLWFTVPSCELYGLEMRVHLHIDTFVDKSTHLPNAIVIGSLSMTDEVVLKEGRYAKMLAAVSRSVRKTVMKIVR